MLPPVAAISSAFFSQQGQPQNPAPLLQAAATRIPDHSSEESDAPASVNGSRLDILSLSGQLQLARGLSVVAETIGSLVHVARREGEALSDYAERLTAAIATLDPTERAALQKALSQILQGLTLRVLTEILRNPAGPDAARLALQFELASYSERDLAEEVVVTSYRQNDGAGGSWPARNDSQAAQTRLSATAAATATALPASQATTSASKDVPSAQPVTAEPTSGPAQDVPQLEDGAEQPSSFRQPASANTTLSSTGGAVPAAGTAPQRTIPQSDTYDALLPQAAEMDGEPAVAFATPATMQSRGTLFPANNGAENRLLLQQPADLEQDQMPLLNRDDTAAQTEPSATGPDRAAAMVEAAQTRAAAGAALTTPQNQDVVLWLQDVTAEPASVNEAPDLPFIEAELDALQNQEVADSPDAASRALNLAPETVAKQAQLAGEVAAEAAVGQKASFSQAMSQVPAKASATSTLAENLAMGFTGLVGQQTLPPAAIMPAYIPYPPRADTADKPQPLIKPVEANDDEPRGRQKGRQPQDRHAADENEENTPADPEQASAESGLTAAVPPETAQDYYKRMIGWM